jgi:glyoxylase-like metal-dependent hydrolase (beta-lactamase superfamily II)
MNGFTLIAPNIYRWADTCNVYVLREGDKALLIDLGDGSVLDKLGEIGVKTVEWVLFTHHHREQCQGGTRLAKLGAKVAASAVEKPIFEQPLSYRKMRPTLGDAYTVHGASYVRPPIAPIAIDHAFKRMDEFAWRGREFVCAHTGGHSPGHMAYLTRVDGQWLAFAGDLMTHDARMHTWFDSEFDYGFAKGLHELANNAAYIAGYDPRPLLPAHGPIVRDGKEQLDHYVRKLRKLGRLYVRGYEIFQFANCDQDTISRPTAVPHLWRISKHLFKFRGPDYWVNFHMLLADNGHALFIDCGLFDREFLEKTIERAKERLGLKAIDAVFVTHMHGDHALDAGFAREKWGAKLWAMEGVVDKFERPWDHDYCALLPMYTNRDKPDALRPLRFDRVLTPGELIHWQGFTLACDWMPGQTKYHSCLHGVVARNACVLEEGYLQAAGFLHGIAPDLLLGGHCWAIAKPADLIERLRVRMTELREAFADLSAEDDYRYMFDPYWARALPYRVTVKPGETTTFIIQVRNFLDRPQDYRVDLVAPPGLTCEPATLIGRRADAGYTRHQVKLSAARDIREGLHLVALDIVRNGRRHGQWFDFIAWTGKPPE